LALGKKSLLFKTQLLILGTGTAIWWLTEPHWKFYLVKIHKVAENSATTKAREKMK
jgi:hypothetical protein